MRSEGYCSWVCVSVKSHLTYGASVRPENAVTYSAGNEGQKICGVFSETAPLQRSSTPSVVRLMRSRPFLSLRKMRMRMSSPSISGALAHVHVYTLQPLRRSLASQTLLREERVWSNSYTLLVFHTPTFQRRVNWLKWLLTQNSFQIWIPRLS